VSKDEAIKLSDTQRQMLEQANMRLGLAQSKVESAQALLEEAQTAWAIMEGYVREELKVPPEYVLKNLLQGFQPGEVGEP
jgi:hypothetical protein